MVNKQYTVQKYYQQQPHHHHNDKNSGKHSNPNGGNAGNGGTNTLVGKKYSPSPIRNLSIISDAPNPSNSHSLYLDENYNENNNNNNNNNCSIISVIDNNDNNRNENDIGSLEKNSIKSNDRSISNVNDEHYHLDNGTSNTSNFGRNITLYNRGEINNNNSGNNTSSNRWTKPVKIRSNEMDNDSSQRFSVKELSINDIGRFQYILQMDKEMGTHPDSLYRIPSRIQKSSSNTSVNSSHHVNFWKAGSESPMTSSSSNDSRRRRHQEEIYQYLRNFWKYAKWPLILIIFCIIIGYIVAYLVTQTKPTKQEDRQLLINATNITNIQSPDGLIGHPSFINNNGLDSSDEDEEKETLHIYMKNPKISEPTEKFKSIEAISILTTATTKEEQEQEESGFSTEIETEAETKTTLHSMEITTSSPVRNTQILKIINPMGVTFDDGLIDELTTEEIDNGEKNLKPTKETLGIIGFTSGHQNNFGVPIEEDERILKMLNDELLKLEQNETTHRPTTDSSVFKTRVSPTLPVIFHHESSTEGSSELFNTTDVGQCESTSLDICLGILHYDLTTSKLKRKLTPIELEHFKYLFDSKCSARAAEFVCSALEPECRPTQMGSLQPCKRICKSILEPCASIIASSEVLTMTFDCDRYPDSSDRNVCEDPTRRGKCYGNEFKCLDSTCIPQQWKCDNIKDCSLGEDEDNCLFCEHEEFRCQSNDKCIPDKWRCDQYEDCPDGSDEIDCYDYDEDSDGGEDGFGPRIYSFASIQSPDSPKNRPYLTISEEDEQANNNNNNNEDRKSEKESEPDHYLSSAAETVENLNDKQSNEANGDDNDEIQTGEASGRVISKLPKNIANFQDSKEIMMTSDSENDFKYSAMNKTQAAAAATTTTERTGDPIVEETTHCPDNQLRCVSGKCITVSQICDRTIDCPDGADEAMCVYKD